MIKSSLFVLSVGSDVLPELLPDETNKNCGFVEWVRSAGRNYDVATHLDVMLLLVDREPERTQNNEKCLVVHVVQMLCQRTSHEVTECLE